MSEAIRAGLADRETGLRRLPLNRFQYEKAPVVLITETQIKSKKIDDEFAYQVNSPITRIQVRT